MGTNSHKNNFTKTSIIRNHFKYNKISSDNIYIFIFRSKIHGTVEQGDDSPHHQRPEKGKRATQQIY